MSKWAQGPRYLFQRRATKYLKYLNDNTRQRSWSFNDFHHVNHELILQQPQTIIALISATSCGPPDSTWEVSKSNSMKYFKLFETPATWVCSSQKAYRWKVNPLSTKINLSVSFHIHNLPESLIYAISAVGSWRPSTVAWTWTGDAPDSPQCRVISRLHRSEHWVSTRIIIVMHANMGLIPLYKQRATETVMD